jgi:hypothetical protein
VGGLKGACDAVFQAPFLEFGLREPILKRLSVASSQIFETGEPRTYNTTSMHAYASA